MEREIKVGDCVRLSPAAIGDGQFRIGYIESIEEFRGELIISVVFIDGKDTRRGIVVSNTGFFTVIPNGMSMTVAEQYRWLVHHDIQESLKKANEEIEEAKEQLARALKAREKILASIKKFNLL